MNNSKGDKNDDGEGSDPSANLSRAVQGDQQVASPSGQSQRLLASQLESMNGTSNSGRRMNGNAMNSGDESAQRKRRRVVAAEDESRPSPSNQGASDTNLTVVAGKFNVRVRPNTRLYSANTFYASSY